MTGAVCDSETFVVCSSAQRLGMDDANHSTPYESDLQGSKWSACVQFKEPRTTAVLCYNVSHASSNAELTRTVIEPQFVFCCDGPPEILTTFHSEYHTVNVMINIGTILMKILGVFHWSIILPRVLYIELWVFFCFLARLFNLFHFSLAVF